MRVSRPIAVLLCGLATAVLWVTTVEAQTRRAAPRSTGRAVQRQARVVRPPARVVFFRGYGYRPYRFGYYGYYDPFFYGRYPFPYAGGRYDLSSVRLEVKPVETEVYVDGYYAGVVDSFNGFFQRLRLPAGQHEIELYFDGYETTRETLYLVAGETYRIRHEMVPLADGAPQPPRPEPPPEPRLYPTESGPPPVSQPFSAPQFGTLAIRVPPTDAEVWIDGERWQGFEGLDRLVVELGAGRHAVEVRREGYRPYNTEVDVTEGDTTLLNISLPSDPDRP